MLTVEDRLDIMQVLSLYGHVIDLREWDRLGEVFVDDLLFDASAMQGNDPIHGLANLKERWSRPDAKHPLAHCAMNFVIWEDPDGTVRAQCKGIGVRKAGNVRTYTYRDIMRKTPNGWRIAERRPEWMEPQSEYTL